MTDTPCKMPCWKCIQAHALVAGSDKGSFSGMPLTMIMIPKCEHCGFKRCPHASDCSLECTGSNSFGQPGSVYIDTQKEAKK